MSISITIDDDKTVANLISAKGNIGNAIDYGLFNAGRMIRDLAYDLAPKDTWALASSGNVTFDGTNAVKITFGEYLPDSRAVYQEFGTVYNAPQSYLSPAVNAIDITQEVAKAFEQIMLGSLPT